MNNGIIIVATNFVKYYNSACYLAETIKDYAPNFSITLYTEKEFLNSKSKIFDNVVTDIPAHVNPTVNIRTKMWCMSNSPYDTTLYLDADMEVVNSEFTTVFDQIKDNDMLWTRITKDREYAFKGVDFGKVTFAVHGGLCLYKSSAKKFMMDWYELWVKQSNHEWWPGTENEYPKTLQGFDQFALWWLLNKESDKYKYLKYDFFEDDTRWNAVHTFRKDLGHGNNPIICHHTIHN